jgi:hypothetical protein
VKVDKGDVLEISSAAGTHGFTTLADPGNHNPRPQLKLEAVQACGETRLDAAFRELECGPSGSRFNKKPLVGTLKLEVTDKFQGDVHFWCTQHERIMWGTIQPK